MINFSLEEDQQVRFTDKIVKVYIINKFKITKTSTNTKRSFHNITTQTICPTYAKQNDKILNYAQIKFAYLSWNRVSSLRTL